MTPQVIVHWNYGNMFSFICLVIKNVLNVSYISRAGYEKRTKTIVPAFEVIYSLVVWEWLRRWGRGESADHCRKVWCMSGFWGKEEERPNSDAWWKVVVEEGRTRDIGKDFGEMITQPEFWRWTRVSLWRETSWKRDTSWMCVIISVLCNWNNRR